MFLPGKFWGSFNFLNSICFLGANSESEVLTKLRELCHLENTEKFGNSPEIARKTNTENFKCF